MIRRITNWINNKRLLKQGLVDTNYYFIALVASRLVGLLIIPVFARLLSVEEFASYDLFILASSFIVLLSGLGMDSGGSIKIAENKDNIHVLQGLLFASLGVNVIVIAILWLVGVIIWMWSSTLSNYDSFFVHGLFAYTLLYQFNYITYNFIRWLGNARAAAIINFCSYVMGVGGGLGFMLLSENSLHDYIVGSIIGSAVGAMITYLNARKYIVVRMLSTQQFKDLMILSVPYVPTYLANYLMQFIDRLLITTYFGLPTLGLYALVNRVGQVVTFGLQVISSGFRPVITAHYADEEGQGLSRRIFNLYWIASPIVITATVLLSPLVVKIFGGHQYEMAIPVLPYIITFVWMLGSFFQFGFGFQVKRKTVYVTLITLLVAGLTFGISLLLIPVSGVISIAQATAVAGAVGSIVFIYVSEKLYPFRYSMKLMLASIAVTMTIVFVFA